MSDLIYILNSIDSNIKKGKTRLAIDELLNLTKDIREDIYNDLLIISNRYNRNINQFDIGLITQEDSNSTENRIVKSIINAKNDLEQSIAGVIVPSNSQLTINSVLNKSSNSFLRNVVNLIVNYFKSLVHGNKIVNEEFYNTPLNFSSNSYQKSVTQKINIFVNDDIAKLNNKTSEKIKIEIANILQVEVDSVLIRKVNSGSIKLEFELPFIYAQKFKLIYNSNDIMNLDKFIIYRFETINPFEIDFSELKDYEIVKLFLTKGDLSYFYCLRERYYEKVYVKCLEILNEKLLSMKSTNEIFLILFLSLNQFSNKRKFSSFIYKTTYRYLAYLIELRLDKKVLNQKYQSDIYTDSDNFLIEVESSNVRKLLNELELLEKILLLMKYEDGMSIKEIQDIFTLDESTTKHIIKFAKEKIRFLYIEKYGIY